MSCTYLRIRTKKYEKYFFCKKQNKEVDITQCKSCKEKEYKKAKPMKCKKHTRTKATAIQKNVKEMVWYRDKRRCIFCGRLVPIFYANAHFIPRSSGGRGIEENIMTLCDECHTNYDNTDKRQEYKDIFKQYLKSKYKNWNEEDLIYKKWKKNGKP